MHVVFANHLYFMFHYIIVKVLKAAARKTKVIMVVKCGCCRVITAKLATHLVVKQMNV